MSDEFNEEEAERKAALETFSEIRECFDIMDRKKTGLLAAEDLGRALRSLGINQTQTELQELIDNNSVNGYISFDLFFEMTMDKLKDQDLFDSLKNSFAIFDPEEEGVLSAERFKRWMMTLGNPLTESEAKEICKLGDIAMNGTIMYDDLVAIFVSELK